MKNSTKILGIFLASILIIGLILLFVAKAYIDSKNNNFLNIPLNKNIILNKDNVIKNIISFNVNLDNIDNLKNIENEFFIKSDEFIKNSTEFTIQEKREIQIDNISKDFEINLNLTKAVIIFSDKEQPKISYKYYSDIKIIDNPTTFNKDKLSTLEEYSKKYYNFDHQVYFFAFIILPSQFDNLKIIANASNIQIACNNLEISNLSKIENNAVDISYKIKNLIVNNLELNLSATSAKFEVDQILAKNSFSYKLNASKSEINSYQIKTKDLIFDFNASESIINVKEFSISSNFNLKENAGNYRISSERFLNYPSTFIYKANMTNSVFNIKNCESFKIKSNTNAASVKVRYNGQTHQFNGDFELSSEKIDEKNLLKVNLDLNMGNIEFIFNN